jgi:subtilisin family serine protease
MPELVHAPSVSTSSAPIRAALVALVLFSVPAIARAGEVGPALRRVAEARPTDRVVAWVRFTDRAGAERDPNALAALRRSWPARSLERRRMRGAIADVDVLDLPVHAPYVHALAARGARVRGTSRWLNAASVDIAAADASTIALLPFVESVELVPVGRPTRLVAGDAAPDATGARAPSDPGDAPLASPGQQAWYGGSWKQNALIGVPALHGAGLSGAGVIVCMLDTGFRTTHEIFAGLSVVARRDFVQGDANVDDQAGDDPGEATHGTMTLGTLGGRKNDTYAGPAYGATFALGRTEDVSSGGVGTETPVELDHWQMGAEWADSLGADVLSSSLGYVQFDSPYPSITYDDLDGQTTVVARAAAEAARRGIVVVVAAGNLGATAWFFIATPADADTAITVGAVDSLNVVAPFSSHGPTSDGRTKPDVTAMGRAVLVPQFTVSNGYQRVSGTSVATPLVAGLAALLLEAHPGWGPFEVREAMRETALNHAAPDNTIGWGLVQGPLATAWVPSTVGAPPAAGSGGGAGGLALTAGPNPLRAGSLLRVTFAGDGSRVGLDAFDARGRRVARLFDGVAAAGPRTLSWDGTLASGARAPAGLYWLRLSGPAGTRTARVVLLPE